MYSYDRFPANCTFSQYKARWRTAKGQQWISNILTRTGMSPAELSELIYCSKQQIRNLIDGKSRVTFDKVCAICYVTGLDDPEEVWDEISF